MGQQPREGVNSALEHPHLPSTRLFAGQEWNGIGADGKGADLEGWVHWMILPAPLLLRDPNTTTAAGGDKGLLGQKAAGNGN